MSLEPPKVGKAFPVLVPQVDVDGNERDGVRLPAITVPLATYAAWNLRDVSIGAADQRVSFEASYISFPKTADERRKTGDPRKSIGERYSGREDYFARYSKRWTTSSSSAGFCPRIARSCCIEASRSGSSL